MEKQQYLDALTSDGAALIAAVRSNPTAPCTSCPEWDLAGLAQHVFGVYNHIDGIVSARATEPVRSDLPTWETTDQLLDLFEAAYHRLVATLRAVDPDEPIWTWGPNKTALFYHRRMVHETAIHRWDAQTSLGDADAFDPDMASDGIDEVLEVGMQHSTGNRVFEYPTSSLHLHRTDGPGEWMLTSTEPGVLTVTQEHGKGDAAVRGPAAGLLLYLWGRGDHDLEIFGDPSVAQAWSTITS